MVEKQISILFALRILFIALLLSGCVTVKRKAVPPATVVESPKAVPPRNIGITKDVRVFKDLQQVDLDGDGTKEIIAIYSKRANENLTGVKVIKIINDKVGDIVFKMTFYTPNIRFQSKKDTSCIIAQDKAELFGLLFNRIYCWDGKSFVAKGK